MKKSETSILGFPALIWFLFFIAGPVLLTLITAMQSRGTYGGIQWSWDFHNLIRVFDWIYLKIFFESFFLALSTAGICLVIGFCIAWAISTSDGHRRTFWIATITIPFLLNLIIRVYAIRIFVGFDGPLMSVFRLMGIGINPFAVSQNQFLVLYGMVTSYLPFMVFPLYAAIEKFDFSLIEANYDLGGGSWQAAWRILIPNIRPAIASGTLMVFVPSLGEYVIPDLLGGAKTMLIGNLITDQFLRSRDWPFGSALTLALVLILSFFSWIIVRYGRAHV